MTGRQPEARCLLEARDLSKTYEAGALFGAKRKVVAADRVSFCLNRGEAIGLVGESGSGKSTIARLLARLEPPDGGKIFLEGIDVFERERRHASLWYRHKVQLIFQDPFASLNPVHTVAHHLIRPLLRHKRSTRASAWQDALDLLRTVGLEPAEEFIRRYPAELSGGQRQRVAIARALAVDPDVLIADEPTSMLDVSIRMEILNLIEGLIDERKLAVLLITHDLASARYLARQILVLLQGRIVESAASDVIVSNPFHPYTRALLSSIAKVEYDEADFRHSLEVGREEESRGCPFAPRCPEAFDLCWEEDPVVVDLEGRGVRCHLYTTHKVGEC